VSPPELASPLVLTSPLVLLSPPLVDIDPVAPLGSTVVSLAEAVVSGSTAPVLPVALASLPGPAEVGTSVLDGSPLDPTELGPPEVWAPPVWLASPVSPL